MVNSSLMKHSGMNVGRWIAGMNLFAGHLLQKNNRRPSPVANEDRLDKQGLHSFYSNLGHQTNKPKQPQTCHCMWHLPYGGLGNCRLTLTFELQHWSFPTVLWNLTRKWSMTKFLLKHPLTWTDRVINICPNYRHITIHKIIVMGVYWQSPNRNWLLSSYAGMNSLKPT